MRQQEIATLSRAYPLVDIIPQNEMPSLGILEAKGSCNKILLTAAPCVFLNSRKGSFLS